MNAIVKGFIAASIATLASSVALAADMPVKAPAPATAAFSWTGAYIGGFVGGAWMDRNGSVSDCAGVGPGGGAFSCSNAPPAVFGLNSSIIGGVTDGYNLQIGHAVFGFESEFGYIHMHGGGAIPTLQPSVANLSFGNWFDTETLRIGMTGNAFFPGWSGGDHVLFYGKFGAAAGRVQTSLVYGNNAQTVGFSTENLSASKTVWGAAVGGGVEVALSKEWSLKGEYEHIGMNASVLACGPVLGPGGTPVLGGNVCSSGSLRGIDSFKFGANYHFNLLALLSGGH